MGKPCPKHTAEFKRRAVQLHNEGGTACAEAARETGVDPSSPGDRVRRAPAAAPDAEASPFRTAEGLRRLGRGNERLKRESEMLLKASALFAGRQLQAPGRRRRGSPSSRSARGAGACRRCARRSASPGRAAARGARAGRAGATCARPASGRRRARSRARGTTRRRSRSWGSSRRSARARTFETRDRAALEMFDCIERFCNRVRIRSALGNLSPEEFEARHAQEAASAA